MFAGQHRSGHRFGLRLGALFGLALTCLAGPTSSLRAADHMDAPAGVVDPATDLGDLYAWETDEGTLVIVLTYAAGIPPGGDIVVDPDVLYSIHFDRILDDPEELIIRVRFGQNPQTEQWGVQIRHLPGAGTDLVGPLGETLQGPGLARAYVDIADDPFFADLDGYESTLASSSFQFDSAQDSFAGGNVMAIVLEMDRDLVFTGNDTLQIWATAGRAP
jgi:hypothetical protein